MSDKQVPDPDGSPQIDRAGGEVRESETTPIPDVLVHVNLRLLLITLAITAVVLGTTFVVHSVQLRKNVEYFVQQADEAEAHGDLDAAIKYLKLYVSLLRETSGQRDLPYVDSMNRLANLYERRASGFGDAERAFQLFEEVLRLDPDRHDSRSKLVDLSLLMGRNRDALAHIDKLLAQSEELAQDEPFSPHLDWNELFVQRGRCLELLGDITGAQKSFCESVVADPSQCEPYVNLARIVATNPDAVCTREEIAGVSAGVATFVSDAFPAETDGSAAAALKTSNAVLAMMVEHGAPLWEAHRQRAVFLSSLRSTREQAPQQRPAAEIRADALLARLDEDQNGTLSSEESNDSEIPAFTDSNGDSRIESTELVERLIVTESTSRLRQAEASIERAQEIADGEDVEATLAVLKSAVDVFLVLAESLQYVKPAQAQEYVVRARTHAARAAELDDRSPASLFAQAQLELRTLGFADDASVRQQRLDEAESLLQSSYQILQSADPQSDEDASANDPLRVAVIWTLADVLISQLERDPANEEGLRKELRSSDKINPTGLIPELQAANYSQQLIEFLNGRLYLADQKWRAAEEALRNATAGAGQATDFARRVALLRVQCADRLGNTDAQVEHTLALVQMEPTWGPARVAHAEAYFDAGRLEEAIEEYSAFAAQPQFTERFLRLLFARETRKPFQRRRWQAIENALGHLEQQPENVHSASILRSELLYQQALAAQQAHQSAGRTDISGNATAKLDEAERLLRQSVAEAPDEVDLRVALVELIVRNFDLHPEERVSRCQDVLTEAVSHLGDDVTIRRAAATAAILQPKSSALPSLLVLLRDNPEFSTDERVDLLMSVARSYQLIDEPDLALELYVEAAELQPTDITIPTSALQLLIQQIVKDSGVLGDHQAIWDQMIAHLSDIEGQDGPYTSYYTASNIILTAPVEPDEMQRLPEARILLRRAERERPSWAAIPRMLGELETLLLHREAAFAHLKKAIELGDRSETVVGRVIEFHLEQERNDEAKRLLELVARERPQLLSGKFAQLAWTIGRRLEENSMTLGVLRERATASDDADVKIAMALDYMDRGDSDAEVEELLRQACNEMPESPRPWLAIVNFYGRSGRNVDALDAIDEAQSALPDDPPILKPLTIARCYDMLRADDAEQQEIYWNGAENHYVAAVEADPANLGTELRLIEFYTRVNRMGKALERIEKVLAPDSKAPPEFRAWALRRQALVAASSGAFEDTTKALQKLKATSSVSEAGRIENLRAQLAIYTSRNQTADRNDMLTVLTELHELTDGVLTTRERYQLAAYSLATGDWPLAQTAYREWIDAEPSNSAALAQFAAALIERTADEAVNLDEARSTLDRLRLIEPRTYRTANLEAHWVAASDEPAEAARQLSKFVQQFSDVSLDPVFDDIREQTDAVAAIQILREAKHLQDDPTVSASLEKADKQIQSDDEDGALAILKQLAEAQMAVVQLRTDALKNAADFLDSIKQTDTAQQLYEMYAERSPRPTATLERAQFLSKHGQTDEALDLCRGAWETNRPEHVATVVAALLRRNGITDPKIVQPFADRLQPTIDEATTTQARRDRLFELGSLQDLLQDYEQAAASFFKIVQENPNDVSAGNNLAYLWARQGERIPEALTLIDHLIQKYGQSAELLDTKAIVLLAAGQSQDAVEILQTIVDAAPGPVSYLHLAEAQAADSDKASAQASLQTAEEEGLTSPALHPLDRRAYNRLRQTVTKR